MALALRRAGIAVEIHEKYGDFQGRATGFSIWAYAIKRLLEFGFERERLERIGREMVRQDICSQDGELTMSLPVADVSATVGAPSMDVERRRLQEEIVELLGVVAVSDPRQIVRARIAHAYPVERWRDGRVVLLGDAAHTLSPYAGMGACSAIEDAAQVVEQLTSGRSLDDALSAYVERRRAKTYAIENRGRRNEWMMMTPSPVLGRVRDWLLERTPKKRLRQIAAEMATGE